MLAIYIINNIIINTFAITDPEKIINYFYKNFTQQQSTRFNKLLCFVLSRKKFRPSVANVIKYNDFPYQKKKNIFVIF